MSMDNIRLIAGIDIGNGYMKGAIAVGDENPQPVDFPSCVAINTVDTGVKTPFSEAGRDIDDIYNTMDASFDTPVVSSKTARLFGQRGVQSGKPIEEFDMASQALKAKQDLSAVLLLGSLAGRALQAYWAANHDLPKDVLHVTARVSVALPISEYKLARKDFVAMFKDVSHMVSIHNFEQPVRIEIAFEDVYVLAEGAAAQYAIVMNGPEMMDIMLQDMAGHGLKLPDITGGDIIQAKDSVGIDIGEGTVNFPVFRNGKFNPDVSKSFGRGYGSVLEQSKDRLLAEGFSFNSRKALSEFLIAGPSKLNRGRYAKVMTIVNEEIEGFCVEVINQFRGVMDRIGSYAEVVYVYGGGATPVKDRLYPALLKVSEDLGGKEYSYPILYLGSNVTRCLNRDGLFIAAKQVQAAQRAQKAAKVPKQAKQ